MVKMTKKSLLVVGLLLCIAGLGLAAYAAFNVTSNVVKVDMQYSNTLSATYDPSVNSQVDLKATVASDGASINNIPVTFYYQYSTDGGVTFSGSWITIGTPQNTNPSGIATQTFTATANDVYEFEAIAGIP